jgi:hypothetical protein
MIGLASELLDEISFTGTDGAGAVITIERAYVRGKVGDLARNADLSRFLLKTSLPLPADCDHRPQRSHLGLAETQVADF